MNVFCCQQICHVPNSEQLYQPRTSNYKLNNYASQSTTSSQIKVGLPVTDQLVKKLSWSPAKVNPTPVYHPTNLSPQKKLYEAVIVNYKQRPSQKSPHINRTLVTKPETPIHGLTSMASESALFPANTQYKMFLRKQTGGQ